MGTVCCCALAGTKACDNCMNNTVNIPSVWQPELMTDCDFDITVYEGYYNQESDNNGL